MEKSGQISSSISSKTHYPVEETLKEVVGLIQTIKELDTSKKNEKFLKLHQSAIEILDKLSLQCQIVLSVLEETELKADLSSLGNLQITLRSKDELNPKIFHHCLDLILKHLKALHQALFSTTVHEETLEHIIIETAKIEMCLPYLKKAATFDKNDLFSHEKDSSRWIALNDVVEIKALGTDEELTQAREKILHVIHAVDAAIYDNGHRDDGFIKSMKMFSSISYYLVRKERAMQLTRLLHAKPNKDYLKKFDITYQGAMKLVGKMMKPSIPFSEVLYIPRVKENDSITKTFVINALINGVWYNSEKPLFDEDLMPSGLGQNVPRFEDLITKQDNTIPVLLISPKKLIIPVYDPEGLKRPEINFEKVIIHIHGGGWAAMSPQSHEVYTRTWARLTDAPIFSIDYSKAPKNPFPAAVDDIWQAYNWIITYAEQRTGISPKKVVLVGDSAGGNLVTALTLLIIKAKRRLPDGILLVYPAFNLEPTYHSPSFVGAVDDDLLNLRSLERYKDAYVEGENYRPGNPLVSPALAPDYILKEFPPTRIIVGDHDGLEDECWRMTERLNNLGVPVRMTVYKGMPHGFLNFDNPLGPRQASEIVREAATMLSDLLEGKRLSKIKEI